MKKKGFTLVELLAVIAILAILVVIAMPNVLGMFNSSKKNTFVTEVQNILKQTATDYVQDSLGYNSTYHYSNKVTGEGIKKLNIETAKDYDIELDSQGNITKAKIGDNSYCYTATGTSENPIKYNAIKAEDNTIKDGACTFE